MTSTETTIKTIPGYNTLPELTGSPKQIKWAESIRSGVYAELTELVKGEDAQSARYQTAVKYVEWWTDKAAASWWTDKAAASWWIDTRGTLKTMMANELQPTQVIGGVYPMSEKKQLKTDTIVALAAAGFKRWTKGRYDRFYIDADVLGVDTTCKIFIDAVTGKAHSDSDEARVAAQKLYDATVKA